MTEPLFLTVFYVFRFKCLSVWEVIEENLHQRWGVHLVLSCGQFALWWHWKLLPWSSDSSVSCAHMSSPASWQLQGFREHSCYGWGTSVLQVVRANPIEDFGSGQCIGGSICMMCSWWPVWLGRQTVVFCIDEAFSGYEVLSSVLETSCNNQGWRSWMCGSP